MIASFVRAPKTSVLPSKSKLIARGRTAEVYDWSTTHVLKLFFDWCPQEWIQREVEVARTVGDSLLRVPRLVDTVTVNGRHGIIFERVEGPSMLTRMSARPWIFSRMAHHLAVLHSAIHETSGIGLPPVRGYLQDAITNAINVPPDLKTTILATLAGLPDGDALCHFDFHPDQVVLATHGPVILDWMTARRGSPLADVARTSVLLRFAQAPYANWLMRAATDLLRSAFHATYLRRYMRLHPQLKRGELDRWIVVVATARIADNVPGELERILDFLRLSLARSITS